MRTNLDWLVTTQRAHYIAVVNKNQSLLYRRMKSLPWKQFRPGAASRETGHGRIETRTVKAVHVDDLDFPHARQEDVTVNTAFVVPWRPQLRSAACGCVCVWRCVTDRRT